jgi:hypothetical protein
MVALDLSTGSSSGIVQAPSRTSYRGQYHRTMSFQLGGDSVATRDQAQPERVFKGRFHVRPE